MPSVANLEEAAEYAVLAEESEAKKDWTTAQDSWLEAHDLAIGEDIRDVYWERYRKARTKATEKADRANSKIDYNV